MLTFTRMNWWASDYRDLGAQIVGGCVTKNPKIKKKKHKEFSINRIEIVYIHYYVVWLILKSKAMTHRQRHSFPTISIL